MLTIKTKTFKTNVSLSSLLSYFTKEELQKFADKIDVYLAHSYRKNKQAAVLAGEIINDPLTTLRLLSKKEIGIVKRIVEAGANTGVKVKKMPKSIYKLQKLYLVISYVDKDSYLFFMPDELRESFAKMMSDPDFEALQSMTAKQERMYDMMAWIYDEKKQLGLIPGDDDTKKTEQGGDN